MATLREATLHAAHGGFGHWDWTEAVDSSASTRAEWENMVREANPDCTLRVADELDGVIYRQNGGTPYELSCADYTSYYLVWED